MSLKWLLGFLFYCINCYAQSWAEQTLQQMSLKEKIGQLFMVVTTSTIKQTLHEQLASAFIKSSYKIDHAYIEFLIHEYHPSGIIFNYKNTPIAQIECTNHFQKLSKYPLLIGQDCEWGLGMRHEGAISYPRAKILGDMNNLDLIYEVGKEIGRQCKRIGVHINFAPVVDVNNNPGNTVIGSRSFSHDPERVASCAIACMKGMQESGILTCAKHFPGHGDTTVDSHVGLPIILHTRSRLDEIELYPFKKIIQAGVDAVMIGHLQVPALDENRNPATTSYAIITQLLKKELQFKGLVITDAMGMKGVLNIFQPGVAEYKAVLAGADIVLCPVDMPKAVALISQAIDEGIFSEQELNERVLKILTIKELQAIHTNRFIMPLIDMDELNTPYAYEIKKLCSLS